MNIFRAGLTYAAGNIASTAVPFLLLPLLTRVMAPEEYGRVVAFSLFVSLCAPIAGLSVSGAIGVAWFNRTRESVPSLVGAAVVVAFVSTAITGIAMGLLLAGIPTLVSGFGPLWGAMAALTAGANVLIQCRLALWQSQHRPVANVVLQFSASACNVALSLIAVLVLKLGADGRNGGTVLSASLVALVAVGLLYSAGEARSKFQWRDVRGLLRYGIFLIPHTLGGVMIGTADRWLVSAQLGGQSLGAYGAAAQLGMVMAILADACGKAFGPWLYERLASKDIEDKRLAVGAIYVAGPFFLMLAIAVGTIVCFASGFLLGEKYLAATIIIPWFMLGGVFTGVYLCTTNLFFFSEQTGVLSIVTTFSAVVGFGFSWLFTVAFGLVGAAAGYAVTQAVLALAVSVVAFHRFDLPWRDFRGVAARLRKFHDLMRNSLARMMRERADTT